jgi:hypothetical protein
VYFFSEKKCPFVTTYDANGIAVKEEITPQKNLSEQDKAFEKVVQEKL